MLDLVAYLESNRDGDTKFGNKVNIVLIETDKYAGNFEQMVCEAVFGYEYSEYIRRYDTSPEYKESMKARGYDSDYFMNLSENCFHEEYGNIIADIFKTPGSEKEVITHDGSIYKCMEHNTVVLFFAERLSEKDLNTVKEIAIEVLQGTAQVIDVDQMLVKTEIKLTLLP